MVLPMVPMVYRCLDLNLNLNLNSLLPDVVQYSTNGTIGNTIGTNGTIGSPNGTIGKPMVPLATNGSIGKISNSTIERTPNRPTIGLTNGTIGTTNCTIGTNVSTNGNIGTNGTIGCEKTFRVLWLPMVPLATNGTIGKIFNGTIGRIPNARNVYLAV